ncbi:hypothetical protein BH23GEM9_BH23GEM9_06780 [soil metagenome]
MQRDGNGQGGRTDSGELRRSPHRGDGHGEVRYREGSGPRKIEPNSVEVERRAGMERRVAAEPVETERRVADRRSHEEEAAIAARERRAYIVTRVTQGVDYLFYLLYGLLGIRFVLALLGASEQAGFVQFVNGMTQPFYAPFAGIVARPALNGGMLDFPLLIAVLAYALLHMAIRGLLRLLVGTRPAA